MRSANISLPSDRQHPGPSTEPEQTHLSARADVVGEPIPSCRFPCREDAVLDSLGSGARSKSTKPASKPRVQPGEKNGVSGQQIDRRSSREPRETSALSARGQRLTSSGRSVLFQRGAPANDPPLSSMRRGRVKSPAPFPFVSAVGQNGPPPPPPRMTTMSEKLSLDRKPSAPSRLKERSSLVTPPSTVAWRLVDLLVNRTRNPSLEK